MVQKARERKPWRGDATSRDYINNLIGAAPSSWRRCLRSFAVWLEEERRLALSSIEVRVASARRFFEAQGRGGVRTLKRLAVTEVEDLFILFRTNGLICSTSASRVSVLSVSSARVPGAGQ